MIQFEFLHPRMTEDHLGFIPGFLSLADPRPAREQIDSAYRHGGGWRPFTGFTKDDKHVLRYPGDPPKKPLARAQLRDELLLFYESAWLAIVQKDGSWEVARVD